MANPGPNCSQLAVRTDWSTYARKLLDQTHGDVQLLDQCKLEVCGALWGEGNGDISGIGMIVGYIQAHILGLLLSTITLAWASRTHSRRRRISICCLEAFGDCATLFAFSIELAAIVVLVRVDYGISATGMGDYTVRITQAVGMVVLLPIIYPMLTFWTLSLPIRQLRSLSSERTVTHEDNTRFGLYVVCWALAFCPFFSRMNLAFGPSKIAQHQRPGSAILTEEQEAIINNMCFDRSIPITILDDQLLTAFVLLAYIPLSIFTIGRILWLGVNKKNPTSKLRGYMESLAKGVPDRLVEWFPFFTFAHVALLAAGFLWSIIHTQLSQAAMTIDIGGSDSDNRWSFGQIIAVTVFAPVAVEAWRSFKLLGKDRQDVSKLQHS